MSLEPGRKLGPYEILEPIGAGGMGEVYRARDTKLDRDVAIKVLPEELANDDERLARFEREAKLLASLNHPNIASIYGFEGSPQLERSAEREVAGVGPHDINRCALVLELVEGLTLAERIEQGPIPIEETIAIAKQIAEALEAGHEAGIIHRDLKPANIKLKEDGTIKVLDYGLAKAFEGEAPSGGDSQLSQSPTLTRRGTELGVILGTAAYMSPEQAKGKRVDKRTDVWAFGAVVYEMLTGKRVFVGEDVSDTLAAVLRGEPDFDALPSETPGSMIRILRLCLTKDAKERLRDIGDVRLALLGAFDAEPATQTPGASAAPHTTYKWVVAMLVLAAASAVATWQLRPRADKPVLRFFHDLAENQPFTPAGTNLALAPDGSRLVYAVFGAAPGLYVRRMDEALARPITGTGGGQQIAVPVFSPDGEWIAYYSNVQSQLKKVAVSGGTPVTIVDVSMGNGMDWCEDNTLVYATDDGVFRVSANGGDPVRVSDLPVLEPRVLPGCDSLLAVLPSSDVSESARVVVIAFGSGEIRELFDGELAEFVSTGHIVFARGNVLFAAPFDLNRLEATGGAVAVVEGVARGRSDPPRAQFALSDAGTLAYADEDRDEGRNLRVLGLAKLDGSDGEVELLDVPPAEYSSPRLSPDGRRVVVQTRGEGGVGTLWVYEMFGDRAIQQLTFEGNNSRPVWTPNGERITFASDRDGATSIYWKPADGSGVAERLTTAEDGVEHLPSSWSPDGRFLAFMAHAQRGGDWDVWTLTIDGDTSPLYQDSERLHMAPEFSPDGNWLAYHSGDVLTQQHVYVEPFPPTGARQRISPDRAFFPMWSRSGSELFFRPVSVEVDLTLRSVDIAADPAFGFSYERTRSPRGFIVVSTQRDYDIAPAGDKVLMVFPADGAAPRKSPRIRIVVNWFEELKTRVPLN